MHTAAIDDQWISFRLQQESYAQAIDRVKEVIEFTPPSPVPGAPETVLGVLNVRGEVITVVSGHQLLDAANQTPPEQQRILIIEGQDERFGVVVDAVEEIVRLSAERIEPTGHAPEQALLVGTARYAQRLLIMVDLTRCEEAIYP